MKRSVPTNPEDEASRESKTPRKAAEEAYTYLSLLEIAGRVKSDAQEKIKKGDLVNCYGVVLSHSPIKQLPPGRPSKYVCSFFIADPSMPYSIATNVCLNIFADTKDQIPVVRAAGDIIRCHRLKANYWNGLQLVGSMKELGVRKGFANASFVMFHAKFDPVTGLAPSENAPPSPPRGRDPFRRTMSAQNMVGCLNPRLWDVHSSSPHFVFYKEHELERLQTCRSWAANMLASQQLRDKITPTFSLGKLNQVLSKVSEGLPSPTSCDLICMFVGLIRTAGGSPVALVWDGSTEGSFSAASIPSDCVSPLNMYRSADAKVEKTLMKPDEAVVSMNASLHAANIYSSCLDLSAVEGVIDRIAAFKAEDSSPVLPGEPLSIKVRNKQQAELLKGVVPGSWLRIRSLKIPVLDEPQSPGSKLLATIGDETHVLILPPYVNDVSQIVSDLDGRMKRVTQKIASSGPGQHSSPSKALPGHLPRPMPAPRAMSSATGEELTNLALVLSTPAPNKFCVRACVMDYWPKDISKFTVDRKWFEDEGGAAHSIAQPVGVESTKTKSKSKKARAEEEADHKKRLDMITEGSGSTSREFMFSIRLADDTGEVDVILFGKNAEFFLGGVSAAEFHSDAVAPEVSTRSPNNVVLDSVGRPVGGGTQPYAGIAKRVHEKLEKCVEIRKNWTSLPNATKASHIQQYYIRSYTDNLGLQVTSSSSLKANSMPVPFKRFAAFNTKLFQ